MKFALFFTTLLVVTGVVLALTGRRIIAEDALFKQSHFDSASIARLEARIPFDIRITSDPPPWCDPLDINVSFTTNATGNIIHEVWQVMDRGSVQMEFDSFDDLYYRCDGPDCFRITVKQKNGNRNMYVTLK